MKTMKVLLVIALLCVLGGCEVFGFNERPTSLNDSIAIGNMAITTIATTVQIACGNLEAGANCVPSSPLKRTDVDDIKVQLKEASILLDAATDDSNPNVSPWASLNAAQRILSALQASLTARGVAL